jgi:hypothetical protein
MLKAGSASHSGLRVYMGRKLVGQVLALGAQAIIGTAEIELRRVWVTRACLVAIRGRTRPEVPMADIHIETLRELRDVEIEWTRLNTCLRRFG